MITAVVFDLDGTLVEFNLDYKRLRAEIIEYLHRQGFPNSLFSAKERASEIIKKAERFMLNNGKSENEVDLVKRTVYSIIDRYELEAARTTCLIPGVTPTLEALKEASLKMGIFTYSGRQSVQYILKRFRLEEFFDAVAPRESAVEPKPSPQHLRTVLTELSVKPEETIVVGDSEVDMNCAHSLNVIAVGIANNRTSLDRLVSAGANYVTSSFTDLLVFIRKINEERFATNSKVS